MLISSTTTSPELSPPSRNRRRLTRLMSLLFVAASTMALVNDAAAAYFDASAAKWQGPFIRVCWAPGIDPLADIPSAIRRQVESTWGAHASFSFTEWETCPAQRATEMPDGHIIFIQMVHDSSLAPYSAIGPQTINGRPRPTVMNLNFSWNLACNHGPGGASNRDCAIWSSTHEFGHALGFRHEHDRPDFSGCLPYSSFWSNRGGGGIAVTTYDPGSIMNYCSDGAGTNKGKLTPRDIVGLQHVYGRKPAGSMVATASRCMDMHDVNVGNGNPVQAWECWGGSNQRWKYSASEGTLRTELAPALCLDDESGGTATGTGLDVWDCNFRANARWDLSNIYIQSLGGGCMEFNNGSSALKHTCMLGQVYNFNARGQFMRVGTNSCLDVGAGTLGSAATLASCDPNRTQQKFLPTRDGQLMVNGYCLEVQDQFPYAVNANAPIRLRVCNAGALTQKFVLNGLLRSSGGKCVGRATSWSNGERLVLRDCNTDPEFFRLHPGDVQIQF